MRRNSFYLLLFILLKIPIVGFSQEITVYISVNNVQPINGLNINKFQVLNLGKVVRKKSDPNYIQDRCKIKTRNNNFFIDRSSCIINEKDKLRLIYLGESSDPCELEDESVDSCLTKRYQSRSHFTFYEEMDRIHFVISPIPPLRIEIDNFSDLEFNCNNSKEYIIYGEEKNEVRYRLKAKMKEFCVDVHGDRKAILEICKKGFRKIKYEIDESVFTDSEERKISVTLVPEKNYSHFIKGLYLYQLGYYDTAREYFLKARSKSEGSTYSEWRYPELFIQLVKFNKNGDCNIANVQDIYDRTKDKDYLLAAHAQYLMAQYYRVKGDLVNSKSHAQSAKELIEKEDRLFFKLNRFKYYKISEKLIYQIRQLNETF